MLRTMFIKKMSAMALLTSLSLFAASVKTLPVILGRTWPKDVVRLVCISDTHSKTGTMPAIPPGDVLIHAGDFSSTGTLPELEGFKQFMLSLPHPQKIVISGNHEITLQPEFYQTNGRRFHPRLFRTEGFDPLKYSQECRDAICLSEPPFYTYLEDSSTVILPPVADTPTEILGINVYGAPWQPAFCNWAFNLLPGSELEEKWELIPDSTDVLITHGPPRRILDVTEEGDFTGCASLREAITGRVKPRLHIFGHIHESYGTHFDGTTTFVNACTCTRAYRPSNPPIVIDLPLDPTLPAQVVNYLKKETLTHLLRKSV